MSCNKITDPRVQISLKLLAYSVFNVVSDYGPRSMLSASLIEDDDVNSVTRHCDVVFLLFLW